MNEAGRHFENHDVNEELIDVCRIAHSAGTSPTIFYSLEGQYELPPGTPG